MNRIKWNGIVAVVLLACGVVNAQKEEGTAFVPEKNTDYEIIECTKGENLAVGANNKVLRWETSGANDQIWRFERVGTTGNFCNIKSAKGTGLYLKVDINSGNASVAETKTNGMFIPGESFTVYEIPDATALKHVSDHYKTRARNIAAKDRAFKFVRIQETSKFERLAIGGTGTALRWKQLDENSQVFVLHKVSRPPLGFGKDMQYKKPMKVLDVNNPYVWNPTAAGTPTAGPVTRTIFSPLDGQPLLTFTSNKPLRNSDGCSIVNYLTDPGTKAHADFFTNACLNHDANYAAPWTEIGWKDGRLLCEQILHHDTMRTVNEADMNEARRSAARVVADTWHRFLEPGVVKSSLGVVKEEPFEAGQAANKNQGYKFSDIKQGGLISVWNKEGAFVMDVQVTYTDVTGRLIKHSERRPITQTVVVPLSIGAKDITVTCSAVAGKNVFKRTYAAPTTERFEVSGTTLNPSFKVNR